MTQRWIAIADSHGDKAHCPTLEVVRDFMDHWKPDIRVHLGDVFDFRWLRKSASNEEKAEEVELDFEAGLELVGWYKPTHVTLGNHDSRLYDLLDSSVGACRHLAAQWIDRLDVSLRGVAVCPYNKRFGGFTLGSHRFLHGYAHGISSLRKQTFAYGSCLVGHTHHIEQVTVERVDNATGYAIGCCCQIEMDYNRANLGTLRQRHGFAYGTIVNGKTQVWQASETDGVWTLPTEMMTFDSSRPRSTVSASPATAPSRSPTSSPPAAARPSRSRSCAASASTNTRLKGRRGSSRKKAA